jgi:hypothetical protein
MSNIGRRVKCTWNPQQVVSLEGLAQQTGCNNVAMPSHEARVLGVVLFDTVAALRLGEEEDRALRRSTQILERHISTLEFPS